MQPVFGLKAQYILAQGKGLKGRRLGLMDEWMN